MIKIEKVSYKSLKRVSIMDRMKLANDPGVGNTLMSALTPTQLAELFPSYYRQNLPDISGFQKAIPSAMTRAKQEWYEEQVQSAVKGDKAGAVLKPTLKKNESTWEKVKRKGSEVLAAVTGKGKPLPKAELTATQRAAIEDLKKGTIPVDDPRVKFMAGLTNDQLKITGIQRIKGEGGKEVFQYTAPQVSEEQARESLKGASRVGIPAKGRYSNAQAAALIRQVGGTPEEAQRLGALVKQESQGNPGAHNYNPKTGDDSYGLWQINMLGNLKQERLREFSRFGVRSERDLHNPEINAKIALYMYRRGVSKGKTGLEDWGAYRDLRRGTAVQSWDQALAEAAPGAHGPVVQGRDPITRDFTTEQISSEQKRLQTEKEMQQLGSLAEFTTATPGQPLTRDPHVVDAGQTDARSLFSRAEQIAKGSSAKHFTFGGPNGGGQHACGVGARSMAGAMFGNDYFTRGLGTGGGDTAASLSAGNAYFQKSGLYNNAMPAGDLSDPSYLASLPVGTVISAGGGKSGNGHVQIKYGPGPKDWASDFDQKGRGGVLMHGYNNYMVHIPNDNGQKILAEKGFSVTSVPASVQRQESNPNPPGVSPQLQGTSIGDYSQPQQQVLTRDPNVIPAPQQETPAPGPETPPATATVKATPTQAEAAKPAGPQPAKYSVNHAGFIAAIKNTPEFKNNPLSWMATEQMIIDGFNDDPSVKAAGVRYDAQKGIMTFKDSNNPDVKKIMGDMHTDSFMKKIEEKKKEEQKKTEVKPGEAKAPTAPAANKSTADVAPAQSAPSTTDQQSKEMKSGGANSPQFDIDRAMALIRRQESGSFSGDYSADAARKTKGRMTASGAYQFNNKTWKAVTQQFNIGTEYKRAVDAPKDVQDAVMRARVEDLYKKHGSIEKVLMTHFTGNPAGKMSAKAIAANKGLTGPQYVASIIKEHGPSYDKMKAESATISPAQTTITPGSATVTAPVPMERTSYTPQAPAQVTPQAKAVTAPVGPAISPEMGGVRKDIHALRDEMNSKFGEIQHSSQVQPTNFKRTVSDNDPNMMNQFKVATATQYSNPTSERALGNRPHFAETGGATAHYSGGNNVG